MDINSLYVTKDQGDNFDFPKSFKQCFAKPLSLGRPTQILICNAFDKEFSMDEKNAAMHILIHLADFRFITEPQIKVLLESLEVEAAQEETFVPTLLEKMQKQSIANYCWLANIPREESPESLRIYCLDLGGQILLQHYWRNDFVRWIPSDNMNSPEIISKCLTTASFYFRLMVQKGENLLDFEPLCDIDVPGCRDIRFSARFSVFSPGKSKTVSCILESIRDSDVPTYWRKKTSSQIARFFAEDRKTGKPLWLRSSFVSGEAGALSYNEEPTFILLVENEKLLQEVAEIFYRGTLNSNFRMTTDAELQKASLEDTAFWKYIPVLNEETSEPELEQAGTIKKIKLKYFID